MESVNSRDAILKNQTLTCIVSGLVVVFVQPPILAYLEITAADYSFWKPISRGFR